jgi:hypothetical protein
MLSAVRSTTAALLLAGALLAACTSTTSGSGHLVTPSHTGTPDFPSISPSTTTPEPPTSAPVSSPTETTHPVPSSPLRTLRVHAADGITYVVEIWAAVRNRTCFDHAYGQVMVEWLTRHPCSGLTRYLGTTTVGGRPVGFAESATGFPGRPGDLYGEAATFARLEQANGTGSLNDLLREGYRLPSGPTSIPSSEAFNVLGQDQGVTVWDAWYLDGPTPDQDPPLMTMTEDLFLRF